LETVNQERGNLQVYINPLINLIWWGGLILIIGTIMAPGRVKFCRNGAPAKNIPGASQGA